MSGTNNHAPVGIEPVEITAAELGGLWTIHFGKFGCRDSETRGGVLHIEGDRLNGGGSHYAIQGRCSLVGTELRAMVHAFRHSSGGDEQLEETYDLFILAEALTPDLFEGRARRAGHSDLRIVIRRLNQRSGHPLIV